MKQGVQKTDKTLSKVSVTLAFGYEQKGDENEPTITHKTVVFGRRPTASQFLKAGEDSDGSNTSYQLALRAASITEFGSLQMPVPMSVLLSLNQVDRNKLDKAYNEFMKATGQGRKPEVLEDGTAQLAFGIKRGAQGEALKEVEFGKMLTGYDEIKLEEDAPTNAELQIRRLALQLKTEVSPDEIGAMDAIDFLVLREAESRWLDSFR